MSVLASTSAPQSGHVAGSGSRTSIANRVRQPRHCPATVSRRSGDAAGRCAPSSRRALNAPPPFRVRRPSVTAAGAATRGDRRIQRPPVGRARRDEARLEPLMGPLGTLPRRPPSGSPASTGQSQRVVVPRRCRRRAAPPYNHRRSPIQRRAVDADQDLASGLSLRVVLDGQRSMAPGLARSRSRALRASRHRLERRIPDRRPPTCTNRPLFAQRLPPSPPSAPALDDSSSRGLVQRTGHAGAAR